MVCMGGTFRQARSVQITPRVPRTSDDNDIRVGRRGNINFVGSSRSAYHKLQTKYAHVFVSRQKVAHRVDRGIGTLQ